MIIEKGVPVGWAITTREDTAILSCFFRALKVKTGPLMPAVFMSDDASQYWNAWSAAYGNGSTRKLLCAWHVDRAWKKAMQENITGTEARTEIYHYLKTLLAELEVDKFQCMLQQFVSMVSESQPDFCQYFQRKYIPRVDQWAACHRINMFVNTNMSLESFHRLLKVEYLEGKQNRRLDHLLHVLLKIARNKAFEQFQKIYKGKITHRITEINKRHKKAVEMIKEGCDIQKVSDDTWTISSQNEITKSYQVQQKSPCSTCKLRCISCDSCVHMYTCSCVDFAVHTTICKHIHATCINTKTTSGELVETFEQQTPLLQDIPSTSNESYVHVHDQEYLSKVLLMNKEASRLEDLKMDALSKLAQLQTLLSSADSVDAVYSACGHINNAANTLKAFKVTKQQQQLQVRKRCAPNALAEKQFTFKSVTKKRKTMGSSLAKPSLAEISNCKENLSRQDITVCVICLKEDDKTISTSTVHWSQCSQCGLWLHNSCGKKIQDEKYMCKVCDVP